MGSDDLIDFEVIENQKENIQSLPSGRSAKALAQLYTPPLSSATGRTPSPSQVQDANNARRQEFERELSAIGEADDPLDVYDRYVKWTLDAYPSAQNTPQSQLCPLLERATKSLQSFPHYKNDPRYLRLWLHYIRFFSDAPRETFAYLSRHHIGDSLALFYEEFAAWLETAGRWKQAEEVFALGIERDARPAERLIRKYGEFQHRFESRPQDAAEPSSPALPTVRPALAARVDPFSHSATASVDAQAQSRSGMSGGAPKSGKPKFAIFSDGDEPQKPGSSGSSKGWDSIGTIADRKKENTTEARPWVGETLKVGKKNTGVQKMMIFKDETESNSHNDASKAHPMREYQRVVNPKTGRLEVVFANLSLVYPNHDEPMAVEVSFEELRARRRGWSKYDWKALQEAKRKKHVKPAEEATAAKISTSKPAPLAPKDGLVNPSKSQTVPLKGSVDDEDGENDENTPPSQAEMDKARAARKARREDRSNRTRKIKVMEVREIRAETQTIQANLDSPTARKVRRKKGAAEPTMTINTKEAMDDIYEIFNQPLKTNEDVKAESESEEVSSDDDDDDDYTSAGESTGTGRISCATSEFGDETTAADFTLRTTAGDSDIDDQDGEGTEADDTDVKSVSEWSEFTESKHVPEDHRRNGGDDEDSTQAAAEPLVDTGASDQTVDHTSPDLVTPTSPDLQAASLPTRFVPIPPEDYDVPTRPYRDAAQAANNRLPFMTPIVEKTESSLGIATIRTQKDYFSAKTPSRSKGAPAILEDGEPWSSPFHSAFEDGVEGPGKVSHLALREVANSKEVVQLPDNPHIKETKARCPIIKDSQCNPVDESIREIILSQVQPPLPSYEGYFEDIDTTYGKTAEIRKFTKAVSKLSKNSNDKTATNLSLPPTLAFRNSSKTYTVKRELGKGAFAPVYLVESADGSRNEEAELPVHNSRGGSDLKRKSFEAMKMEDPPSPWEFYIMRTAERRLSGSREIKSIIQAYEMHVFKDECYLLEEYRDQGTILDLVNIVRADNGVMDEQLAMFFAIELFRTIEALHSKSLIHGDLKSDNVLVRFDALEVDEYWTPQYRRDGRDGWSSKGVALIDFGRGIDMKVFHSTVQFIADWKTSEQDCAEMRELRPWTYQVDYHGLAGIIHNLLFGKYISTVAERGGMLGPGANKTYKIRESLKRYWQTEIWGEVFDLLLNPLMHLEAEEENKLPALNGMKNVRERMEQWLEGNCEKGVGLKSLVRKMEDAVNHRRR